MLKLIDLKDAYLDQPAAILGGGPSLVSDYRFLLSNFETLILIGVNHHPQCVGIEPHIMLFMDNPMLNPLLFQVAKDFGGIKVTPDLRYTDVHMAGVNYWAGPGSAPVATWLACWMGCAPVLLCGMDLYQGPVKYCHPNEIEYKPIFDIPLDKHLQNWKAGFKRCPGIERVRAVSGPLVDIFGAYR